MFFGQTGANLTTPSQRSKGFPDIPSVASEQIPKRGVKLSIYLHMQYASYRLYPCQQPSRVADSQVKFNLLAFFYHIILGNSKNTSLLSGHLTV